MDYQNLLDLRNAKPESVAEDTIPLSEAKKMVSEVSKAYPQNNATSSRLAEANAISAATSATIGR